MPKEVETKKIPPLKFKILNVSSVNEEVRNLGYFRGKEIDPEKIKINHNFNFDIFSEEKRMVEVFIHSRFLLSEDGEDHQIMHYDIVSIFEVENFDEVIITNEDRHSICQEHLVVLYSIAFSNARGYICAKSESTSETNLPLPVVFPAQIIGEAKETKEGFYYFGEIKSNFKK